AISFWPHSTANSIRLGPEIFLKPKSPRHEHGLTPRVFHLNLQATAPRIVHLNLYTTEQAPAPWVFDLNRHSTEQAATPRVLRLGSRDLAPMIFHLSLHVDGQVAGLGRFFRKSESS
ncbi:MAG: hypothetical protein ABSD13_20240, partial [Candidatus Korobacteraceae bacterium]